MLKITGKCLGVITEQRGGRNGSEPFDVSILGIQGQKVNGFPGETETVKINISKSQSEMRAEEFFNAQKGKDISIPIYVTSWGGARGSGINYNLSDEALAK